MEKTNKNAFAHMPVELFAEGLAYAEDNYLNEEASHLKVDKQLLRRRFQLDGKRILDFGCGMGGMTLWYATTWDCEVTGIDIDGQHIAIAQALQQKHGLHNVRFEKRDVLVDPPQGPFDFIVMNDVAEHIPLDVLPKIFQALAALLADDGQIFVSYPPWQSPYASHVVHAVGIPWCQYLPRPLLLWLIRRRNQQLVGELESDLVAAWEGLNHLTHRRLKRALSGSGLHIAWRKSHSILNRLPGMADVALRFFPFHLLITKEFVVLEKDH